MALTAALLGWMFDGLEMGLFPLVAGPALGELVPASDPIIRQLEIDKWLGVITALFLVGAATGGVLFGWLGDRIGRVRSMMLSVLTYALVSGLCAFATETWHVGALRFVAAMGMGGEWSLGVALINEIWPDRSRVFLAGLIGAAANVGYLLIGAVGLHLDAVRANLNDGLLALGLPDRWVLSLMGHDSWRLLMMFGAVPALLTLFIRLFVPESQRWLRERQRGATSFWLTRDLFGVLLGSIGACGIIAIWTVELPLAVRLIGTLIGLGLALVGYVYPVVRYLQRAGGDGPSAVSWRPTLRIMLLAACLSGVALLGTWGSTQQAPTFAWNLAGKTGQANKYTQIWTAFGAVIGTPLAAFLAHGIGRRFAYSLLCLGSLIIIPVFFLTCDVYDDRLLFLGFLMGAITASFYGWLPLYLPELFPTTVRATGQGFGFNFGRILAAMGVLQLGNIQKLMQPYDWGLAQVCASLSAVYLVGLALIWFAPETKGKPLPE
ncbi:MAG: MFS transporter [Planctomycetes bacterium]|nr:MFS transporter [Planctomycetota bacterium]